MLCLANSKLRHLNGWIRLLKSLISFPNSYFEISIESIKDFCCGGDKKEHGESIFHKNEKYLSWFTALFPFLLVLKHTSVWVKNEQKLLPENNNCP